MPQSTSTNLGDVCRKLSFGNPGLFPKEQVEPRPSQNNPVDLSSRRADVSDLMQSELWWNGPDFLNSSDAE